MKSEKGLQETPGHVEFMPYPEFRLEHLPELARTSKALARVRHIADSTVRLRVGYTSTKRPKKGFPFAGFRGSRIEHTGTGWVEDVHQHPGFTCPCR